MDTPLPPLSPLTGLDAAALAAVEASAAPPPDLFAALLASAQAPRDAEGALVAVAVDPKMEPVEAADAGTIQYLLAAVAGQVPPAHPGAAQTLPDAFDELRPDEPRAMPRAASQAELLHAALEKAARDAAGPEMPGTLREAAPADPATGVAPAPAALDFANAAHAHTAAAAHTAATAARALELRTPVNVAGWDAELGRTLLWIAAEGQGSAQIRLNPPELGPLAISVTLGGADGANATVTFASPHSAVRDAIESALPQLRDMLAESGLQLGQATVSAESFTRQDGRPSASGRAAADEAGASGPLPQEARVLLGLVDTFV